jgi:hypothetical protein
VSDEEPSTGVRLSLGWEGHEHLELDSAVLASLVERLVDAGVVASIRSPARDARIQAVDFLPHADVVVEESRVCASLRVINRLGMSVAFEAEMARLIEFLGLASFHAGFAVTYASG